MWNLPIADLMYTRCAFGNNSIEMLSQPPRITRCYTYWPAVSVSLHSDALSLYCINYTSSSCYLVVHDTCLK